jgi:hypothetical protein
MYQGLNVCNLFAAFPELDAAARSAETERWAVAIAGARGFLSAAPDHRDHYGPKVDLLPGGLDLHAAEDLLDLVPYF